jgi:hypothetical protein
MTFTLLVPGSTRLLQLQPRRWSTEATAFRSSGRGIASPPSLRQDLNADSPTTLVRPDCPSDPLVIREGAPTLALVLLSSTLVPGSTNVSRSMRLEIERCLPLSILVPGRCPAFPPPSPNHRRCLPFPGLRAMVQRPMATPNPPRLHPSRTARRDLGRRNRFRPFLPSNPTVPTVSYLSLFFRISSLTLSSRFCP